MKLHPPVVVIDEKAPFKNALFGRKEFAESLTTLLRHAEDSIVLFVHAPWGEGKTTFAQMWRAYLRGQKLDVIYFDAYSSDYFEDPFISFSGEILALVDKKMMEFEGVPETRREFKKTATEVGKKIAGLGVKVGLRALTMGVVDSTHIDKLKEIGTELSTGISEIGADVIEKRIEHYTSEKDALKTFKQSLAKLAALVRKQQGFPLTIIVDELDRCRPDFALGLLERIKHLFDVEGIAFVLLVNRDQIESYVHTVYGETVDARGYLLKFANLFVDLPTRQPEYREEQGRHEFCRRLFTHYNLRTPTEDNDGLGRGIRVFAIHFNLTLREIERTFTLLSLYYGSLLQGQFSHGMVIALLAVLKVKRPDIYRSISTLSLDAGQFMKETRIEQIEKNVDANINREWMLNTLNFFLMSDAEIEKIPAGQGPRRMSQMLFRYNFERRQALLFLIDGLDRFSFQPTGT